MATDLNIAPYFNDYDELKNYHHILFRPGFAVQARELTELQSILKNQIEKFGDHIFRHGSVVIPGNCNSEIGVAYVTLDTTRPDLLTEGRTLVGSVSGVKGIIKKVIPASDTDPITVYVSYITGGTESDGTTPNGNLSFQASESINIDDSVLFTSTSVDVGIGSLAYVNRGVYYVNGTFVTVESQSIVIDKFGIKPHCHVLLKIHEKIVTVDEDDTLLDPAYGSHNFAAPGADRYQITLELLMMPYGTSIDSNYVELMRYNDGVLEEHARYPKYNELEKSLARRTYDESGDYIVYGLTGTVREHYRENTNGGLSDSGSRDNYAVTVSPGKAYINGFEVEKLPPVDLIAPKGRTADHAKSKQIDFRVDYGRYILVTNVIGELSIKKKQRVNFYDSVGSTLGNLVGTARILNIDYFDVNSTNPIYKLWLTDIETDVSIQSINSVSVIRATDLSFGAEIVHEYYTPMTNGNYSIGETINNAQTGGRVSSGVVQQWVPQTGMLYLTKNITANPPIDLPALGEQIAGANGSSKVLAITFYFGESSNVGIIPLPTDQVASFETVFGNSTYDFKYTVQSEFAINTNASGAGSSNSTNGIIRSIDTGTVSVITKSGVSVPLSRLNISANNKSFSISGGPSNDTLHIFAAVEKNASNAAIKTKTLIEITETGKVFDVSGKMQLDNSDVYSITSITSTGAGTLPLSNITLHRNQTDYAYLKSSITVTGMAIPTETFTVKYKYFAHGPGDFFCFDSYRGNADHHDLYLYYKSSSGTMYNLKNCIDFRSTAGANDDFISGANVGDPFIPGDIFSTSSQYYVPRYDLVVMDKTAKIYMIQGIPKDLPDVPLVPTECIALEKYYVPGYTEKITDIKRTRLSVDRFTMKDISDLSTRVENLEDFSTLLAAEINALKYEVIDEESGLAKFKTGYLVETFRTPLVIADLLDPKFYATFYDDALRPAVEEMHCPVKVIDDEDATYVSSNFANTGGFYTLPYVEVPLISQPMSSRVTNLNPFLIIKWNGILTVSPDTDYWIEQLDLPVIAQNQTEIVTITRWIEFPDGPTVHEDVRTGTTVMPVTNPPFVRTVFV